MVIVSVPCISLQSSRRSAGGRYSRPTRTRCCHSPPSTVTLVTRVWGLVAPLTIEFWQECIIYISCSTFNSASIKILFFKKIFLTKIIFPQKWPYVCFTYGCIPCTCLSVRGFDEVWKIESKMWKFCSESQYFLFLYQITLFCAIFWQCQWTRTYML